MSENKLDKSLDDILSTRRKTGGRRARGRRVATASSRVTRAAPVGGVQKATKSTKTTVKTAATPKGPAAGTGDTKIIVSNLPSDVTEPQIKEYFGKSVGPVRRAMLTYGPNGVSRGIATIIFSKPGDANNALTQLNGVLVDKRPMRIEVVLDAAKSAKGLDERIVQPKSAKPKPATAEKPAATTSTRGGRARGRGGRRGRNSNRPKTKTADELDAEMVDYFDANAANGTGAPAEGAPAATGGAAAGGDELGMEEIS